MNDATKPLQVELLQGLFKFNDPEMPNWSRITGLIYGSPALKTILNEAQSHDSTYGKIRFAKYHYYILNQLYRPDVTERRPDTENWVRAEMNAIITSLYSALDSLAYEINLVYQLKFKPSEVHIYHNHMMREACCFRCAVPTTEPIWKHLSNQLDNSWFTELNRLRNIIVHKNMPVLQLTITVGTNVTRIIMPDDPSNTDPQVTPTRNDFSKYLEVNQYCKDTMDRILQIVEEAYALMDSRLQITYNI